jgi:hypothetical protein
MTDVAQTEEAHRGAICISVGVFFFSRRLTHDSRRGNVTRWTPLLHTGGLIRAL